MNPFSTRLFNLVSQYGLVKKIIFTKTDLSARVIMTSSRGAADLHKNLFNQEIFGEIIQASLAEVDDRDENPVDFDLEDGSRSFKNFDVESSPWPEIVVAPSKVEFGTK